MPHLRFRGLTGPVVSLLSKELAGPLSEAVGSPQDHFTYEVIQTQYFFDGEYVGGSPFVEILWFAREQSIQNQVTEIITTQIKSLTPELDVVVVFTNLSKQSYYENGEHF